MSRNSPRQDVFLLALAGGRSVQDAAAEAGVNRRTATRWLADPDLQRRLTDLRAEMLSRATAALTSAATQAAETLQSLLQPEAPAHVRRQAAKDILEQAIKLREATALEERLAAIEEKLASGNGAKK